MGIAGSITNWDEWAKKHHIKVNYQAKTYEKTKQQTENAKKAQSRKPVKNYSYKI